MSYWIKGIGVFYEEGQWKLVIKFKNVSYIGAGLYSDTVKYILKNEEEANEIMKSWCMNE